MREPGHIFEAVATMVSHCAALKWSLAGASAVITYFLPTPHLRELALGVVTFVILDTLTGIMASSTEGKAIKSAKFSRLITKSTGYSIWVILATIAAKQIPTFGDLAPAAASGAMVFALVAEGISIGENLDRMGVPLPKVVKTAFRDQQEKQ